MAQCSLAILRNRHVDSSYMETILTEINIINLILNRKSKAQHGIYKLVTTLWQNTYTCQQRRETNLNKYNRDTYLLRSFSFKVTWAHIINL